MLSSDYNILEFIEKIENCNYQELIQITNREATEAERQVYKYKRTDNKTKQRQAYALLLKDIILYLRHGVKSRALSRVNLDRLRMPRQV